jgi:hypothetical protein
MQHEKATALAYKSMDDLVALARQVDVRTLGFDNLDQVMAAKPGQPINDVMVRLDELKDYRPGDPAAPLMRATGRLIYPLEVDRATRSSVVLSSTRSQSWSVESFGGSNHIRIVTEQRRALANKQGRAEREFFQVRIPALNLVFMGMEKDAEVFLSPLFDAPSYGLEKGKIYPAAMVLEKLIDAALRHTGEPT